MGMPSGIEIVIIVLVILLFFGAKRIPELARGLGQGIKEFRKASDDLKREIDKGAEEEKEPAEYKRTEEKKAKSESESESDKN